MQKELVLDCRDLRKRFADLVAVDGISFTIEKGETYGLLGPNGAGKTTTISMICGLLESDAGKVFVAGQSLTTDSVAAKAAIGYVPQELAIYPDLTGRENLSFFARLYGMTGAQAKQRCEEILDVIGLTDRADDQTENYSGGMRRRLNIGIGLLHRPLLLVLDEPTVGVDPQSRNAILDSIQQLGQEGIAVLYTTHYMEEAERLCDRVGIMDFGEIKAEGTRDELTALVGAYTVIALMGSGDFQTALESATKLEGIQSASITGDGIELIVTDSHRLLPELLTVVTSAGVIVSNVEIKEPNLESVFLHLTGRALRD